MPTTLAKALVTASALAVVATASPTSANTPAHPEQQIAPHTISLRAVNMSARHQGYTIKIRYPHFRGNSPEVARLNSLVKRTVNMNIAAQPGSQDIANTYSCDYHAQLITAQLVSIDFQFTEYEGGAHERTFHVPFNYSVQPMPHTLTLRDVLGKRVDYAALSRACFDRLPPDQRAELSMDNPTPTLAKQATCTFTSHALVLTFSQGKIGAQASGCPTATIPYASIRKLFGKRSPLHDYVVPRRI